MTQPPSAPTLRPKRCETCKERFSSDNIEYVHERCPMSVWLNTHLKLEFLYSHIGIDLLWLITSVIGCASHSTTPDADARQRIVDVVKELEAQIVDAKKNKNHERVAGYEKAIALLKDGVERK